MVANGVKSLKHEYRVLSQYLTEITFDDQEKTMLTLKHAKVVDDFRLIKQDYQQTKKAALLLEIIDQMVTDEMPHQKVYTLIVDLLKKNIDLAFVVVPIKMLFLLGYALDFVGENPIGFSVTFGGVSTKSNQQPADFNLEETVLLSQLYFYDAKSDLTLSEADVNIAKRFIIDFYKYHLDYTFKSFKELWKKHD